MTGVAAAGWRRGAGRSPLTDEQAAEQAARVIEVALALHRKVSNAEMLRRWQLSRRQAVALVYKRQRHPKVVAFIGDSLDDLLPKQSPLDGAARLALALVDANPKGAVVPMRKGESVTGRSDRRAGRPRKPAPAPPNIGDLDLATLQRFRQGFMHVIVQSPQGRRLTLHNREKLAEALADELVYVVPTIGLSTTLRSDRRGPKARLAQVVLMAQVASILRQFKITPREWVSGERGQNELTDWCRKLLAAAGLPRLAFSERQRRYAMLPKDTRAISGKYGLQRG